MAHREWVHESDENGGGYEVWVADGDERPCDCGNCDNFVTPENDRCDICKQLFHRKCFETREDSDYKICPNCIGVAVQLAQDKDKIAKRIREALDYSDRFVHTEESYAMLCGRARGGLMAIGALYFDVVIP